jgi:hypothetical protein
LEFRNQSLGRCHHCRLDSSGTQEIFSNGFRPLFDSSIEVGHLDNGIRLVLKTNNVNVEREIIRRESANQLPLDHLFDSFVSQQRSASVPVTQVEPLLVRTRLVGTIEFPTWWATLENVDEVSDLYKCPVGSVIEFPQRKKQSCRIGWHPFWVKTIWANNQANLSVE